MAKVSVIIPVYNVEKYLKKCLKSVQNQTLTDIEIICIDDGSTDQSGKILDAFGELDERFIIVHQKNSGYGKAVNTGIKIATAPYIGIVESDDWIESNMYEQLYMTADRENVDLVKSDHFEFYERNGEEVIEKTILLIGDNNDYKDYGCKLHVFQHEEVFRFQKYTWAGLYNREFLLKNQIFHNETVGASYQDTGFWFLTLAKANTAYFINQAFYHYRIDNPNSSMFNKSKPEAVKSEYAYIERKLQNVGVKNKTYEKWIKSFLVHDLLLMLKWAENEKKEEIAIGLREILLEGIGKEIFLTNFFSLSIKGEFFDLLVNPQLYVECIINQENKLFSILNQYSDIILYGAGKIALDTYGKLKFYRQFVSKIRAFAVTEVENNKKNIDGIPIRPIRELKEIVTSAIVIIVVGETLKEEMFVLAHKEGFKNLVYVKDLF